MADSIAASIGMSAKDQAVLQAWYDTQLLVADAMAVRIAAENERSRHRNMNRIMVVGVAWFLSTLIPLLAHNVIHMPVLAGYAASVGFGADIIVTAYAWHKRY